MTRIVFDGPTDPIRHPLWESYFTKQKDTPMIAPVTDHRLNEALLDHIATLTSLPAHDRTDAQSVQREIGFQEALLHLAKRGGLTHAGREEARKLVEASKDWVAEYLGEEGPGHGR